MRRTVLLSASIALAVVLVWGAGLVALEKPARAAFPGKNGKIAYEYHQILYWDLDDPITAPSDIYLANPSGSGKINLTKTAKRPDYDPAIGPYGKRVAFVGCPDYGCGVYTVRADGTDPRRIADGRSPAWSPDGKKLAFVRYDPDTGDSDIWTMEANGTNQENITSSEETYEDAPAWSPLGGRIAFSRDNDIWTMGVDGTAKKNFGGGEQPSWSPDGKKIVFVADTVIEESGGYECYYSNIYTMDAGGSARTQITRTEYQYHDCGDNFYLSYAADPAYSPDGRRIAFVSGAYHDNVLVMNRDGSGYSQPSLDPYPDSEHGGVTSSPDWGPIPGSLPPANPDEVPPDTKMTSGPEEGSTVGGSEYGGWATFSFSSNEEGSSFECRIDGLFFRACASPKRYSPHDGLYTGGGYTFEVRAVDAAGNADPSPARRSFTVDPTADARDEPTVTGLRPKPGARVRDRTPTIGAVVRDATAELSIYDVNLRVDDRWMPRPYYNPQSDRLSYTTRRLSYGRHTIVVRANDQSGNAVEERWSFRVVKRR